MARDVFDILATHSCLVYDVTDTDCWAQNGGTHRRVLRLSNVDFNKQDPISFSYVPVNMAHDASSILFPLGDFSPTYYL